MVSGRSRLEIDDGEKDAQDAIVWKWATARTPRSATSVTRARTTGSPLCLYDESGEVPALVFGAGVPANEGCHAPGGRPCWKAKGAADNPRGFAYQHRGGVPDGIDGVTLKTGRDGRAKIVVAGGGKYLDLPALPVALPLRAQLQSATGQCWESSFAPAGVRENTATRFRARSE